MLVNCKWSRLGWDIDLLGKSLAVCSLLLSHICRLRDVIDKALWDISVSLKDTFQLSSYQGIVRDVFILKGLEMIKYLFNLGDILGDYPELLFWIAKALCFDVLHFIHGILLLFSPL